MKRNLISFGLIVGLSANFLIPTSINPTIELAHSASDVNFDQAGLSDEDYVKSIMEQYMALDAIQIEYIDINDDSLQSSSIYDSKNQAVYMTIKSPNYSSESYSYNDGTTAETTAATIDMLKSIYPDKTKEIDAVAKEIDGQFLVHQYPEAKGQVDQMMDQYLSSLDQIETYEKKDGVVIASTPAIPVTEVTNGEFIAEMYTPDTTIQSIITVDPKAKTLIYETIIDINEENQEETTTEDELGNSFSDFVQDIHSQVILTPSTEKLPSLDSLETITQEEFNSLLTKNGLEALY